MDQSPEEPSVIYLKPVAAKRYAVLGLLYLLAGVCAWVAVFETPEAIVFLVLMWGMSFGALLLANAAGKATGQGIKLTSAGLFTDAGELLVELDDIQKIDRGVFAIKPSNGFLLRLKSKHRSGWAPGLWWRMGRVMGVGGVTSKIQAEIMAEAISSILERRATS